MAFYWSGRRGLGLTFLEPEGFGEGGCVGLALPGAGEEAGAWPLLRLVTRTGLDPSCSGRVGGSLALLGRGGRRGLRFFRCWGEGAGVCMGKRSRKCGEGGYMSVYVEVFVEPSDVGRKTHVCVRRSIRGCVRAWKRPRFLPRWEGGPESVCGSSPPSGEENAHVSVQGGDVTSPSRRAKGDKRDACGGRRWYLQRRGNGPLRERAWVP